MALALATLTLGLAGWLMAGANRGWTKTSVAIKTPDQVTGIEGVEYQDRFVPGLDFLAATGVAAAGLAGVSLCFRRPHQT